MQWFSTVIKGDLWQRNDIWMLKNYFINILNFSSFIMDLLIREIIMGLLIVNKIVFANANIKFIFRIVFYSFLWHFRLFGFNKNFHFLLSYQKYYSVINLSPLSCHCHKGKFVCFFTTFMIKLQLSIGLLIIHLFLFILNITRIRCNQSLMIN